jgi:hypothetical protein
MCLAGPVLLVRRRRGTPSRKDLGVVPVVLIILERAVERREPALDDELADDLLVPIPRAGVDSLGREGAKIDAIVVRAPPGRATVAHVAECSGAAAGRRTV